MKRRTIALTMIFVILTSTVIIHAETIALQWWKLVDSGWHLDYDITNTQYGTYFQQGAQMWNSYDSGVIRQDTLLTICDVSVYDMPYNTSDYATTYIYGEIHVNTTKTDTLSSTNKKLLFAHEIGHCFGIDHLTYYDVMAPYGFYATALTANDKASYNAAKAQWGPSSSNNNQTPIYEAHTKYAIDVTNYEDLYKDADVVIVGAIGKLIDTEYYNISYKETQKGKELVGSPLSKYVVQDCYCLKGDYIPDYVYQMGGIAMNQEYYVLKEGDRMLEEGATYLLFGYIQNDGKLIISGMNSSTKVKDLNDAKALLSK